jgi:hypothetical protein
MNIRVTVTSLFLLSFLAMPASAHHSFAAQYDSNKPVTMTGLVTKVEWANPHVYLYIDVADGNGCAGGIDPNPGLVPFNASSRR